MKIIEAEQRSEGWFNARRGLPTCSRFGRICTASKGEPSKQQEGLIDELIAESVLPPDAGLIKPAYISEDMHQGMILEAEARCAYELEYATAPVRQVGFILHDSGLFGGSPDALVGDEGGAEIKCPLGKTHIGYIRAGDLPADYKAQVHGYMLVTGRAWWDFFSYSRHFQPMRLRVERDGFTDKLHAALLSFCARYNAERAKFDLPPIGQKP